jgi:hypothetical protein
MHAYPPNIRSTGYLKGALVLLSVFVVLCGRAQSGERLPDSVSTSKEVLPPAPKEDVADSTVTAGPADMGNRDSSRQRTEAQVDSVVLRTVPDSAIASAKKNKDFEYANDPEYWKTDPVEDDPPSKPFTGPGWYLPIKILVIAAIAGALLLVLYKFFYRAPRRGVNQQTDKQTAVLEDDLDKKLRQALQARDHRLSTRYLFLKALRLLDERKLIRYQAKATNHEYVLQMSVHEAGPRFGFLAGAYEHVWYGDFSLSEPQFDLLLHYFEDFYKTINSRMR